MTPNLVLGFMRIQNFGAFQGRHIFYWNRGPGLWYISGINKAEPSFGANGAAKTTLVVALYWCLYGRTLRNTRPGDRIENRVVNGTCSVHLDVTINGEQHDLYRSRRPNKLTLDGNPVTDAELSKLLPDPEIVLYSFIVGQTGTLFLDLKPEPQSQLFTDLLQLDIWLDAADRASKVITTVAPQVAEADREIASHEGGIAQLEEAIEAAEKLESEYESVTNRELEKLDSQTEALRQSLTTATGDLRKLAKPTDVVGLKTKLQEDKETLRKWERVAAEITAEITNCNRAITRLEAAQSEKTCPTCGQDIKKNTSHIKKELVSAHQEMAAFTTKQGDTELQVLAWRSAVNKAESNINRIRDDDYENVKKRTQLEDRIQTLKDNIEARVKERRTLYESENPHTSSLRIMKGRHDGLEAKLQEWKDIKDTAVSMRDIAELWRDGFRAIRLEIIDATLTEVSMATNNHAEALGAIGWQVEFVTERETKRGTTSLGFSTLLYQPGYADPIPWDTYSGGESQRLQLAATFGLGEVLLGRAGIVPNVEIYDEPTRGLSQEGIRDLLDCLSERAQKLGRTIWIIDHHSLEQGNFDGMLTVVKDQDGARIEA